MEAERDVAAVRVFPPLIPVVTVLAAIGLNELFPLDFGVSISSQTRWWFGGGVVVSALVGLGGWSVFLLRRDGQSENPWKPTFKIIEKGPYRISRNPMYLQMVLVCLGLAFALLNWWLLVLTPLCGWLLQKLAILPEERYLEAKFSEDYLAYKQQTRRRI